MRRKKNARAGYTLIELGVVLAILVIISGFVFTSQGMGRDQLILIKDKATVTTLLYRAKAMSLQRFATSTETRKVCAFGVVMDPTVAGTFLFGDAVQGDPNKDCKIAGTYQGSLDYDNQDVAFGGDDSYIQDSRIVIALTDGNGDSISDFELVFVPPDPTAIATVLFPISINFSIRGRPVVSSTISINEAGLIIEQ